MGWGQGFDCRFACALLTLSVGTSALAQTAAGLPRPVEDEEYDESSLITVTGQRERGAVVGDIVPEQQLNVGDIRALGVSTVAELLEELAPQTRSDRGRGGEQPVTLLNGRRISGFAEIRDLPSEAIQRVDILPEEAALKYGYSANQRVVNIVLRRRFRSIVAEAEGATTTRGGGNEGEAELNLLRIRQDQRLNLNVEYNTTEAITEAQRNLISRGGGTVPANGLPAGQEIGRYRTIRPATKTLDLNSVYSRNIFGTVGATVNATLNMTDSDSLRGLPSGRLTVPAGSPFAQSGTDMLLSRYLGTRPLTQSVEGYTGHLGITLDKDIANWRLSLTGGYDRSETRTRTARGFDLSALQASLDAGDPAVDPYGAIPGQLLDIRLVDRAKSISNRGNAQIVASGPLAELQTGPLSASLKAGFDALGFEAQSFRAGVASSSDLSRTDLNGQASFDLPITSPRDNILAALGDVSLNLNGSFDRYSDFGTLGSYGYGLNWKPMKGISLIASVTHERAPPSVQQLGNPSVATPDVRTFDYVRGTTVDIIQLGGGNPLLRADNRRVIKLGATVKPFKADVTITANYIDSVIRNSIAGFPEPTAAIEAAFPDRFSRDVDGNLLRVDARPINFERQSRSELRWGLTFTRRLKTSEALAEAMRNSRRAKEMAERRAAALAAREAAGAVRQGGGGQGAARGPGGGRGQGGGGFGGGPGGQGGRLQFSMFHTWHLKDEVLIRRGLPVLDLLKGDSLGSSGGTSEHELEAQLVYSNNGIGGRLNASWQSGTTVVGAPGSPSSTLRFSPYTRVNARVFVQLSQIPALIDSDWAQGARISLRIDNLFDSRQRVRDATGATPLRYQPGYLDPAGRTIKIEFRKLIF